MVKNNLERIIIAAVSKNRVIGKNKSTPWNSKEDQKHFNETTINNAIIIGRKTFQYLGKPLDKRKHFVITSTPKKFKSSKNVLFFHSVSEAFDSLRDQGYKKVFICGGERIYRSSIKYAEKMIISHMNWEVENGDAFFPNFNRQLWKITKQKKFKDFTIKYYTRKKN